MLQLYDILLTVVHLAIIFFNLFGWIPKATRKANFISIVLTAASWFILGLWFGIGYCPFTDWQWQVKTKLGEHNLPNNFVAYMAEKITGKEFNPLFIAHVISYSFAMAALCSIFVNFILPFIHKQKIKGL